jgi:hypothetical protein
MSWQGGSARSYRTLNVCFRAERRSANLLIATGFAAALLPNLFVHRRAAIAGPTIKPVRNFAFRDSAIDLFKRFSKTAYCWATWPMPRNSSSVNGSLPVRASACIKGRAGRTRRASRGSLTRPLMLSINLIPPLSTSA